MSWLIGPLISISCNDHTEAWKRLVIGKVPSTICLQLMRFSPSGDKLQHMLKNDEVLKLEERSADDDSGTKKYPVYHTSLLLL